MGAAGQTHHLEYKIKEEPWKRVSAPAFDFVKQLLAVNADKRPTAKQAMDHPWIAERHNHELTAFDSSIFTSMQEFSHSTQFRRDCFRVMAWSLTSDEHAKVRDAFEEMDREKTGEI